MAADIHAYHATLVPVGDDQRQHIELANDIAEKFNHDYGVKFFPRIETLIPPEAARIMSLRDATKKMSKSDPSDQSRINLNDDADAIALKIRRAKTDPQPLPETLAELKDRPEANNLLGIYAAITGTTPAAALSQFAGSGFGPFKEKLAEALVAHLAPITAEAQRLLADQTYIDSTLQSGGRRAAAIAEPIVDEAERIIGFLPR
jgi:tryptophanyl-tRNA synthetase